VEMPFEHYAAGERLYNQMVAPVCEKHALTYMEFTILLFLANNPQYDTAAEIVKYRRLVKSHVSTSIRSLQEKGLLSAQHWEPDRRTQHLKVLPAAQAAVEDGQAAQKRFGEALFEGFSGEEYDLLAALMDRIDGNIRRHLDSKHEK